ncbi:helix-turn-helix domain-containing protein [Cyclobacterium sp. 1_MG-2023]|uniref:helix-turn-helix domain-containing protein n=1 Tax=Cyclobacterium sp. 1_MG-2023 TaxID=3062681 RepID=UPI0026E42CC0|nr:helix-turn-helix domain-containing protein [Cyclobacterium sp. 1_MG-2023]MDO6437818.1 helix-turn-helix domain-containing protein [Cyclobacterium sp. 1_MG-2023]
MPTQIKAKDTLQKSIAVLPFVNMSSDKENEYFCDGITEEIINALAKIDGLRVTSRTSSFYFKGKNIPISNIGQELGVETLLEGSVRLSGNSLRITAQLIQADEDFHFWSETWDRKSDNIFAVQDEVSLLIAEKLREHFGHFDIQEHLVTQQTESLDAYTLYLKGRYYLNKWNPEDCKTAIDCFNQALRTDPNHPNSLTGLADSYSFLATTGFISYEEGWGKCAALTNQALAINNQLPEAYYQLANLSFFTEADFEKSFNTIKKGLDINPNHVESQQFLSFLYILAGQNEDSKKHLDFALKIDPLSQETQFYSAYLDYMLENYQEALVKLHKCLEVNPRNIPAHTVIANSLVMLGEADQVIDYFDRMPSEIIVPAEKVGNMALAYILKEDENQARSSFRLLNEISKQEGGFAAEVYILLYHVYTGQFEKAFDWMVNAKENKYPLLLLRFADPMMNAIKAEPRYLELKHQLFPPALFDKRRLEKTKKALLNDATVKAFKDKLTYFIEEKELFLNPDLSLRSLAEELDIHPNQLSWILNESIGKNFNAYINHYRIKEFKRLAKDPSKAHITVIGLAYESGFNSKTVFNTYFKKETGLTPRQFLKNLKV